MIRLAIFSSGSGTNAENIIKYFGDDKDVIVEVILSNNPKAYVHQRAKFLNIDSLTFSKQDFVEGEKILDILKEKKIDFIILAGFLLKIPQNIIDLYPDKIINIHPALLPKYGGKGMYGERVHRAVVEAQEKESGITIHYINENYDEGDVIFQARCSILPTDTYKDVADKVHQLEYEYFPEIIDEVIRKSC